MGLVEVPIFSKSRLEVSLVAKFGYDIAITVAGKHFEAFEDIWVVEFFKNVNLGEEELL